MRPVHIALTFGGDLMVSKPIAVTGFRESFFLPQLEMQPPHLSDNPALTLKRIDFKWNGGFRIVDGVPCLEFQLDPACLKEG